MNDDSKIKCANCSGNHSSASPSCSKYEQVKQAWITVAEETLSYAEAIRKVMGAKPLKASSAEIGSRKLDADIHDTRGRVDLIEAITPSRNWAKKAATQSMSIGTQTDDNHTGRRSALRNREIRSNSSATTHDGNRY